MRLHDEQDRCAIALLMIDVISDMAFEGSGPLVQALRQMQTVLKADVAASDEIDLERWRQRPPA
jgi:hypothetical protein